MILTLNTSRNQSIALGMTATAELVEYLHFHESDIAYGMDDFDDLRRVFREVFGYEARKEP